MRRLPLQLFIDLGEVLERPPQERIREIARGGQLRSIVAAELAAAQLAEDVELAAAGGVPVRRMGWSGGVVPSESELALRVEAEAGS